MPKGAKSNAGLVVGLGSVGTVLLAGLVVVASAASNGAFGDEPADVQTVGWRVTKQADDGTTAASYPSKDGDVIVRVGTSEVVGYDLDTGDRAWQVPLPTNMSTCATANIAPDDIAAVVMGANGECTDVLAVDVNEGKRAWTTSLPSDGGEAPKTAAVTTAEGRVFVSTPSRIARYDAKLGTDATGDAGPDSTQAPRGCEFGASARANSRAVFAIMRCTVPPSDPTEQPKTTGYLAGYSATSLKGFTRTELANGPGVEDRLDVVTAAPVVVLDTDADENGVLRFFDSNGKQTASLKAKQDDKGTLQLDTRPGLGVDTDGNREFAFQQVGKTMVVPVDTADDEQAKVAGVNLEKGTWSWTKTVGRGKTKSQVVLTLADDDKDRVSAVDTGNGLYPQIVTIEGKNGDLERADLLPKSAAPADTDAYMSLGPAFVRLRAAENADVLYTAYGG